MTTIVVVKKDGQVVIAGVTLTTFGSTRLASVHDAAPEKLLKHGNSYFGIAGSAAHQLVLEGLLSTVRAQMERDSDPEEAENGKEALIFLKSKSSNVLQVFNICLIKNNIVSSQGYQSETGANVLI